MKLFSLSWFLSEKEKELQSLKVEEQKLKNEILEKQLHHEENVLESVKPYRKVKLVNDVLTIVLVDGNIITKSNATQEDFNKARECKFEHELLKLCLNAPVNITSKNDKVEEEIAQKAIEGFDILKEIEEEFEVENGSVYFKGIKRSLPPLLVSKLAELCEKYESDEHFIESGEFQSLKKFWLKCCLNPNAQSAEDLYTFLSYHQFKIDRHGNFYAYRRVVSKEHPNKKIVEFVSDTYNKIKAVWKKKTEDYFVYSRLGDFKILRKDGVLPTEENPYWEFVGVLKDLYLDLPSLQEKNYTDDRTGTFDYRVGEVISMPRDHGDDDNTVNCSRGFHAASKKYDYSSFGDTPILMIINPMDVLSVPIGEVGKLRTCRWFFASVLDKEEQYILDSDEFDVTDLGDIFEEKCMENLQDYVKNGFAEEVKRHTFTLSGISSKEVEKIVNKLEEMKEVLNKRVVNI